LKLRRAIPAEVRQPAERISRSGFE